MKKFLIIIPLIFLVGCSVKPKIYMDGIPIPNSTYNTINPKTKIRVEAYAAKCTKKKNDNNDLYIDPTFIDIGKSYRISKSIDFVRFGIKVTNPNRYTYQIRVQYHIQNNDNYEMVELDGYKGNSPNEKYTIKFNKFNNEKISVFLIIYKFKNGKLDKEIFNVKLLTIKGD